MLREFMTMMFYDLRRFIIPSIYALVIMGILALINLIVIWLVG